MVENNICIERFLDKILNAELVENLLRYKKIS